MMTPQHMLEKTLMLTELIEYRVNETTIIAYIKKSKTALLKTEKKL